MITTHVLDTAIGRPAAGVGLSLARWAGDDWQALATGATDADGRCRTLTPAGPVEPGRYRLRFDTEGYLAGRGDPVFFPVVEIVFQIVDGAQHFHVPLLLSPFGYSTYRGS